MCVCGGGEEGGTAAMHTGRQAGRQALHCPQLLGKDSR